MNTSIRINKNCEFCGDEFIAKITVTRFCGHTCAARAYKKRKRDEKIANAI